MTFVITNDDGIDAPGIWALRKALGDRGIIIAPLEHHSGCSHQLTTHRSIRVEQRSSHAYAVAGTPADCTRLAITHLYPDAEWVISGINEGANLGTDTYTSGTVAAVREAAFQRVPGIAISQYIHRRRPIDWERTSQLAAKVLDKLMSLPTEPGLFWNVNLPHPEDETAEPEIIFCAMCTQPLPTEYVIEGEHYRYAGRFGDRRRDPGADVDVCFSGNIAVTAMRVWPNDVP
ncbi:5'/3'-nucleotidase SurE [Leptolyngbya sp. FACHB-16]|uniref:5'/3'-nucleotidase SurE n=1 Tax=unclassified Leptolyngbya TaxID=2650499 RepID=UPI001683E600|nr:5'/3'-nucleotidase SurE [Leptolyngbya sp. FACHB-16]MBD2157860.1 5'/3'-nucleotidase SurE [Leptolyngbya sp. FACHB-16]